MFTPGGVRAYQAVQAAGDSPWRLIDRLYEVAIQRIDEGNLEKARVIVSEGLIGGLNPAVPLSRGLCDAYEAVVAHLGPGGSPGTARQMLRTLHDGWREIRPAGA